MQTLTSPLLSDYIASSCFSPLCASPMSHTFHPILDLNQHEKFLAKWKMYFKNTYRSPTTLTGHQQRSQVTTTTFPLHTSLRSIFGPFIYPWFGSDVSCPSRYCTGTVVSLDFLLPLSS